MATENGISPAISSRSHTTADSYIGSLISLTSKSEIRYDGVLYTINPEESSIGLKNVRSFGTEGRKKDGPQIPPSDKVYEYILFRGSDIKDLHVRSSSPVQPSPSSVSINNDPAIIQSHNPHAVSTSTSLPTAVSRLLTDYGIHNSQIGLQSSNFQSNLPLYQSGGPFGTWGASPPSTTGSGLAMPMFWPGYFGHPNGVSHLPQQSLLQSQPPGLPMLPSQQPMQYPNFNGHIHLGAPTMPTPSMLLSKLPVSLPDNPPPIHQSHISSLDSSLISSTSLTFPPTFSLPPAATPASASLPTLFSSQVPNPALSVGKNINLTLPSKPSSQLSAITSPFSSKLNGISSVTLSHQGVAQSTACGSVSSSLHAETSIVPSLVTPGQLLKLIPTTGPIIPVQASHRNVEVIHPPSSSLMESSVPPVKPDPQPLLPLPTSLRANYKPNGAPQYSHYGGRVHERGRGILSSHPVTRFSKDFDFIAMNEKFNKDEVWGHLGKKNKSHKEGRNADDSQLDADEFLKTDVKYVYNKDDFFDTLSCNAFDHESPNGRSKFSEQKKLDNETFGDFSRYRHGDHGGRSYQRGSHFYGYFQGGYGHRYCRRGRGSLF